jgi:6-phosphogluconate dehydrogenase
MQMGMVGLGRMGANMVRRLLRDRHDCVVYDLEAGNVEALTREGAVGASSLDDLVARLAAPRIAWLMVPSGEATEQAVRAIGERLAPGDVLIDGGNSYFKDDVRRAAWLEERGVLFLDVGTSGGVWGLERGYCLMIGGPERAVNMATPLFQALAPGRGSVPPSRGRDTGSGTAEEGFLHCGPAGAGHFVKMVHNGIEYGLMQAYAEGFDILHSAGAGHVPPQQRYQFDVADIAELWRRGSVVGSWLLDLAAIALAENPTLSNYTGFVRDSGEGRWTVVTAVEEAVPADVLSASLYARFRSRQQHTFAEKMLSAMRHQFGGHVEPAPRKS